MRACCLGVARVHDSSDARTFFGFELRSHNTVALSWVRNQLDARPDCVFQCSFIHFQENGLNLMFGGLPCTSVAQQASRVFSPRRTNFEITSAAELNSLNFLFLRIEVLRLFQRRPRLFKWHCCLFQFKL